MSAPSQSEKSQRRSIAVGLHESGLSYSEVAKQFHVTRRTVINWVAMSKTRTDLSDLPRSGRPEKLSEEDKELVKSTLKAPSGTIRRAKRKLQENDVSVAESTVWKAAEKMKLKNVKARKKPKLTNGQNEKRLAFAESASQDPKY